MNKHTKFTYFGGMCVLIERTDGFKILLDPYIVKNKQTQAKVSDFYDVDLIFVTHHAGDHYGDVADIMDHSNAKLVAPSDCIYYVKKDTQTPLEEAKKDPENGRLYASAYGDERVFGVTKSHTVQAVHLSKGEVNGVPVFGLPSGFVIEVEPGVTYYHPGDTALHNDIKLVRDLYHPNIMCVGISNIKPLASREMGPREAAMTCAWVGADIIIPTHYYEGSTAMGEFEKHMESFYPEGTLKKDIDKPFYFVPAHTEDV